MAAVVAGLLQLLHLGQQGLQLLPLFVVVGAQAVHAVHLHAVDAHGQLVDVARAPDRHLLTLAGQVDALLDGGAILADGQLYLGVAQRV